MGNGTHVQRGIMVNFKDRDVVPWGMGHMGDGAHGQWGTWAIRHMIITSLILHGSLVWTKCYVETYFSAVIISYIHKVLMCITKNYCILESF